MTRRAGATLAGVCSTSSSSPVSCGTSWAVWPASSSPAAARISQDLQDLEARRAEAQKRLDEVEKRISNLESERKAILDESLAQAESVKQAVVEEAKRQAEQIVQQARRTAENEGRAMLAEVRAAIADEIVDAAEKVLAEKLTAAEHEKLITNSLNKVVLH